MADRKLRAVTADDVPESPRKPKTVSEAAKTGTLRELLVATRNRIADAVEHPSTPARDLAALTKRLLETVREIEALDAREDADDASSAADAVQDGVFDADAV